MEKVFTYGNPEAATVLIQMADDRDLEMMEKEAAEIQRLTDQDFCLTVLGVARWNHDLSPWEAPALFGKESFGNGAPATLREALKHTSDCDRHYYIGGYSLAGLFALWAVYQTDAFEGAAAVSPSIWFPGFTDYMTGNEIRCKCVYLSLGDREERTKNPIMSTVGERIREAHRLLEGRTVRTALEWNQGNHFKDAEIRTARGFAWLMNQR